MEKKLLVTIILVVIASLSIAGCTSSSTPVSPIPTATPTPTPTPTPKPTPTPTPTPTITPTPSFSVLFFYEPGCPHCANLENSASFAQLQNKVPVQWISSDTQLNNQYGVSSWPTMILLKNGVNVQSFVGDEDATAILARINAGY